MKKRYEFDEIVRAVVRFDEVFGVVPKGTKMWEWLGVNCYEAFVRDYSAPGGAGGVFEIEPNPRLEMLLSPYWQTLLKAWTIHNVKSAA